MIRASAGDTAKDRSGEEAFMSLRITSLSLLAGAMAALAPANAQESVKIGLILPMTGGQASTGKQIDNAVKLYMQQKGNTVAGKKIEVILKDDAAIPDNTKQIGRASCRERG